jgi:hypothetical protein
MSERRVTDTVLLEALALLGHRFTTRDLKAALAHVGVSAFTQARFWLLHHAPNRPALIRARERVKTGFRGRPIIVYEVTESWRQKK